MISTYRVGGGDFLEFFRGHLVAAGAVRVVLHRELLVGRVDLLLRSSPGHLVRFGSVHSGVFPRACGGGGGGGGGNIDTT